MPTIADYLVISHDEHFKISTININNLPSYYTKTFTLETGAALGQKSVLSFVLIKDSANCTFDLLINGSKQMHYNLNTEPILSSIHEVIAANVLKAPPSTNEIKFMVSAGNATLEIDDVVLQYQRTI